MTSYAGRPCSFRSGRRFIAKLPSDEFVAVLDNNLVENDKTKALMAAAAARPLGLPTVTDVGDGPEHVIGASDSLVIKGSNLGGFFGGKKVIPETHGLVREVRKYDLAVTKVSPSGAWVSVEVPNKDFVINDRFVAGMLVIQTPAGSVVANVTYIAKIERITVETGIIATPPYFDPGMNPWKMTMGKNAQFAVPGFPRRSQEFAIDRVGTASN